MKVKLGFRLMLLTGMLFVLVSTFQTQPAAACGSNSCLDGCANNWANCIMNGLPLTVCNDIRDACKSRCTNKAQLCESQ